VQAATFNNPSPARKHERERDNILLLPTLAWGGRIRQFSPSAVFAFLAAIQHARGYRSADDRSSCLDRADFGGTNRGGH